MRCSRNDLNDNAKEEDKKQNTKKKQKKTIHLQYELPFLGIIISRKNM